MVVFYGSQTGTAEDFATRLAKDSVRYGMKKGMAADPEEYDMVGSFIGSPLIIIIRGRPWRYSVIPSTPDFQTEYQIRRNSNPAGLPVLQRFGDLVLGLASLHWPTCLNR